MVVLITGGAGFIGSWVARRLLERDPDIRLILVDRKPVAIGAWDRSRVKTVQMDLKPGEAAAALVQAADACIHCALGWGNDVGAITASDTCLTAFLASRASEANHTRFLYTSSVNAIGIRSKRMDECSLPRPHNLYAASKAASEALLAGWSRTTRVSCMVVRPSYAFGLPAFPGGHMQPSREFPEIVAKALAGEPIVVTRHEGAQFIPVEDLADFYVDLFVGGPGFEIYIAAGDQYFTWAQIAGMIVRAAGSGSPITEVPGVFAELPNLFSSAKAAKLRGRGFPAGPSLERYIACLVSKAGSQSEGIG